VPCWQLRDYTQFPVHGFFLHFQYPFAIGILQDNSTVTNHYFDINVPLHEILFFYGQEDHECDGGIYKHDQLTTLQSQNTTFYTTNI
jgi:hypothetical protein